jgi:hypothetical protein
LESGAGNDTKSAGFAEDFVAARITESLVAQSIGATASIEFCEETRQKLGALLSGRQVPDWRFVIDGPAHSGTSTILLHLEP